LKLKIQHREIRESIDTVAVKKSGPRCKQCFGVSAVHVMSAQSLITTVLCYCCSLCIEAKLLDYRLPDHLLFGYPFLSSYPYANGSAGLTTTVSPMQHVKEHFTNVTAPTFTQHAVAQEVHC
jgi:hypothetical protein